MKHKNIIFIGMSIIFIMELFDAAALNPVLPQIAHDLSVNPLQLKLAITVYIVTLGLFTPLSGWLAVKMGLKKTLIISLIGFVVFSALSGMSRSLYELVFFRACQGMFAAFTAPVMRLAMVKMYDDIVDIMAKVSMIALISPFLGSLLSGALATWVSWRLIFFINVPLGAIAFVIIAKYFPKEDTSKNMKFDWIGFLSLGGAIACIFYFSNIVTYKGYTIDFKVILALISIGMFTIYILTYKLINNPIINLNLFKAKLFRSNIIMTGVCKLSLYWIFFSWPVYLYVINGLNSFMCALMMTTVPVGTFASKVLGKKFITKFDFKITMLICLIILAALQFSAGFISLNFTYIGWVIVLILTGFFLGSFQLANNAYTYKVVDEKDMPSCNTISILSSQVGTAFSITFAVLIFYAAMAERSLKLNEPVSHTAFATTFFVSAVVMILLAVVAFRLPKLPKAKGTA